MTEPATITLMRLIAQAPDRAAAEAALAGHPDLHALWADAPQAWEHLRGVLDAEASAPGEGVARWAAMFDRAVAICPEASVALYSLGRPDLLNQATGEVLSLMAERIAPDQTLVEIGCGIGRFLGPIAEARARIVGLDVSMGMLREARRRSPGALAVRSSGLDLSCIKDGVADTVFCIDAFPYLVEAGVAEAHVAEAARLLKPGGHLLVVNWSYRGDLDRDRADAADYAARHGFALVQNDEAGLTHWDGRIFRLIKES